MAGRIPRLAGFRCARSGRAPRLACLNAGCSSGETSDERMGTPDTCQARDRRSPPCRRLPGRIGVDSARNEAAMNSRRTCSWTIPQECMDSDDLTNGHWRTPMRHVAALLLALFSAAAAGQTRGPLDLADAQVPAGARRIAYGADPLQFGELRVPSTTQPHPVAIVIHGGCWVAKLRNMDDRAVALDYMRPLAAALTEAGIA